METKPISHIAKGVIISFVLIILGLITYLTNQMQNKVLGWLQFVVLLAGIIYACISFAKQMNGNVTFGKIFAHGFKTTLVIIAITIVWTLISMKILFPDMETQALNAARMSMEKQGKMSGEQIDQAMQMTSKFFMLFATIGTAISFAFLGAIAALIGAGVSKKNPPQPGNLQLND